MGVARFIVSNQLLHQLLCLPANAEIQSVTTIEDSAFADIEIVVSSPDLRDAPSVERPPLVTPTFKKQEPAVLTDWGQDA
jgi:hypothetical protein